MDFFEVVKNRHSIRAYKPTPVEPEKLRQLMEAVRLAPSARNRQPWKFIVVTDKERIRKIYEATKDQDFVLQAPVVIAAVAYPTDYINTNGNIAHFVDLGIAGEHLALACTALGLGACWVVAFYQDKMKAALEVPEDAHVVAIFPVGYPDEVPKTKERKPLSEIVHAEKWGGNPPDWA